MVCLTGFAIKTTSQHGEHFEVWGNLSYIWLCKSLQENTTQVVIMCEHTGTVRCA